VKVLLQRTREARVTVDDETLGATGPGLLLFLGAEKNDDDAHAHRLASRVLGYRVFPDDEGKMNRSVLDMGGELLVVPQFTLAADTRKGTRPSFSSAAPPEQGHRLYEVFVAALREGGITPATGRFGADMQVQLINDGPVTFLLES
jgi:D-tyrosyl-tRNA(Tyr) deacylase